MTISEKKKYRRNTIVKGRAAFVYEGPKPDTFAQAAILGGLGAVIGGIMAGPLGAALGGAIGGAIGGWAGEVSEEERRNARKKRFDG